MTEIEFTEARCEERDGDIWLCIKPSSPARAHQFVFDKKGTAYVAQIQQKRDKRSLNANAYAWTLMDKMAEVLRTDKDSVYLTMLERYGRCTYIAVIPEAAERVKETWRTARELGEVTVNGKAGIQLQCYYGSSTYNTKEMSRLIDGIVSECKDLGIETMTPEELARIKEEWGR